MDREKVSILAIGSEILDGRIRDTNSQWIAAELTKIGVSLHTVLICDDDKAQIVEALKYLSNTSSYLVVSGGLGPTSDDATREAIRSFCRINPL